MTASPYLRPTVTQRIRRFLDDVGEKVPPWTDVDGTMDALWGILQARQDDPRFWARLEALVESLRRDVEAGRRSGLPDAHAEILDEKRVGDLMARLRQAVRRSARDAAPGAMRRFTRGLAAPIMGCVMLLGTAFAAAGCEEKKTDAQAKLEAYVDDSSLAQGEKDELKTCFRGLSEQRKDELVDLFKTQSAEEIAAYLEGLLQPGGECFQTPADADTADIPADPAVDDAGEDTGMPDIAPPYKGVTF